MKLTRRQAFALGRQRNGGALGPMTTASDIRFTTKGDVLYAIAMGRPDGGKIAITALAPKSPH